MRAASAALAVLFLILPACAPRAVPADPALIPAARMALPARIAIPTLGIDARVAPVGLDPDGAMDVPGTADEVGWYEEGARPGERGNAVLAGHNAWNGRPGVFAELGKLRPGDRVSVTTSMHTLFPYVVERVVAYRAQDAPVAEVFGPTDEPTLTLITCSGGRDADGNYVERLVVKARAAR